MKVLVYSAKEFERPFLDKANNGIHNLTYVADRLTSETAMKALGHKAISIFSADDASPIVLEKLKDFGVKYITLRSAGHDNINVAMARKLKFKVANAPDYSPHAIAEHGVALLQSFNRRIVKSQQQIRRNNFSLDQLVGMDIHNKKVGVMGTGRIGSVLTKIMYGFGCSLYANDTVIDETLQSQYDVDYISKEALCRTVDILFVCLPLTTETYHLIDESFLNSLEHRPLIVNIARGAIVKTKDILRALDEGQVSGYVTDVYEKESGIFFYDHSDGPYLEDPQLLRLLNHPKVLLTPHQAFATREALKNIAQRTIKNLDAWEAGKVAACELVTS
ncbi:NAD(P)-dependent oxidoreductase [Aureisphaera galaxeae]|uniref:NAD(P)-dependent oxidoreductase n=1 Tax=Aureisphaera galaxeae TaxID=1538023 RepID=UPI00234FD1C8|nr:NAD(P)-dependent oxidoreductase [Aureisphaera galaxeae]MDC8003785.1 NAD(P)-dependent oxidoreductase [Aureisphaera galaxeae]